MTMMNMMKKLIQRVMSDQLLPPQRQKPRKALADWTMNIVEVGKNNQNKQNNNRTNGSNNAISCKRSVFSRNLR